MVNYNERRDVLKNLKVNNTPSQNNSRNLLNFIQQKNTTNKEKVNKKKEEENQRKADEQEQRLAKEEENRKTKEEENRVTK